MSLPWASAFPSVNGDNEVSSIATGSLVLPASSLPNPPLKLIIVMSQERKRHPHFTDEKIEAQTCPLASPSRIDLFSPRFYHFVLSSQPCLFRTSLIFRVECFPKLPMKKREKIPYLFYPAGSSPCHHSGHLHRQACLSQMLGGSRQVPHHSKPRFPDTCNLPAVDVQLRGSQEGCFLQLKGQDFFSLTNCMFSVRFTGERMGELLNYRENVRSAFFFFPSPDLWPFVIFHHCSDNAANCVEGRCGRNVKVTILRTSHHLISCLWPGRALKERGARGPGSWDSLGVPRACYGFFWSWLVDAPPWKE